LVVSRRGSNPADTGVARSRRRQTRDGAAAAEPCEPDSAFAIPGISEDALTPELREGLARLAAERNRLRDELAKARNRISSLERLADEDPLTAVANRRAFVRQLTRMIAFTHRYGVPASVVYFDLNNMKHINDEHGHPIGDAALRHLATVLREKIRSSDIVGRLGGDEFGVILAQTDEEQAHSKAAALADAIAETPLRAGGHEIALSAAYGVYAFAGTDDPLRAIEAADRAMYQQKRAALPAEPDQTPIRR
jgi:diguanylate cyclase (GGDEF)-like protein